jgi:hypothetical protein
MSLVPLLRTSLQRTCSDNIRFLPLFLCYKKEILFATRYMTLWPAVLSYRPKFQSIEEVAGELELWSHDQLLSSVTGQVDSCMLRYSAGSEITMVLSIPDLCLRCWSLVPHEAKNPWSPPCSRGNEKRGGWYEKSKPPVKFCTLAIVFRDEVATWRIKELNSEGYELLYGRDGSSYQTSWAR